MRSDVPLWGAGSPRDRAQPSLSAPHTQECERIVYIGRITEPEKFLSFYCRWERNHFFFFRRDRNTELQILKAQIIRLFNVRYDGECAYLSAIKYTYLKLSLYPAVINVKRLLRCITSSKFYVITCLNVIVAIALNTTIIARIMRDDRNCAKLMRVAGVKSSRYARSFHSIYR